MFVIVVMIFSFFLFPCLPAATDLIGRLLQVSRRNRFRTTQALEHIWLRVSEDNPPPEHSKSR